MKRAAVQASPTFKDAARKACVPIAAGKGAVKAQYRAAILTSKNVRVVGSVDMDTAYCAAEPNSARWDYGLGLGLGNGAEWVCWVEPHPASSTSQVAKILAKLDWLEAKLLQPAFADFAQLTRQAKLNQSLVYVWLYEGANRISANSREARALALRGVALPKRQVSF